MKGRGEESKEGSELICDKIAFALDVFYIQESPNTGLDPNEAIIRTFVLADSRSKGETAILTATRAWVIASGPSSAMRGRFSATLVTNHRMK